MAKWAIPRLVCRPFDVEGMRKLAGVMNRSQCTAIFINQLREKVGIMFGNPETTPGGRALKFYSSVRLDVRRSEAIKNGSEIVGNKVNVKVVKTRFAPPFKVAAIEIMYGEGISHTAKLSAWANRLKLLTRAGPGSPITERRSGRAAKRCGHS